MQQHYNFVCWTLQENFTVPSDIVLFFRLLPFDTTSPFCSVDSTTATSTPPFPRRIFHSSTPRTHASLDLTVLELTVLHCRAAAEAQGEDCRDKALQHHYSSSAYIDNISMDPVELLGE